MPPTSGSPSTRTPRSARRSPAPPRPSRALSPICTCGGRAAGASRPPARSQTAALRAGGLCRRLVPVFTEVADEAGGAGGAARGADGAPVQDQPVVRILAVL